MAKIEQNGEDGFCDPKIVLETDYPQNGDSSFIKINIFWPNGAQAEDVEIEANGDMEISGLIRQLKEVVDEAYVRIFKPHR